MKQIVKITNIYSYEVEDDAQILPAAKQVEPRARIVLSANINKPIIDADALQQKSYYDMRGFISGLIGGEQ